MRQEYDRPVTKLVELRHSVRNYTDQTIPEEICEKIENYIQTVENPFHKKVRIRFIQKDKLTENVKLGTYGAIRGANNFLVSACEPDAMAHLALGYTLEKVVLYCTSLGLGTVWLGGTYKKSQFAKVMGLSENEVLPIVCPVGYEGGKKTLLGTLFGNHRKDRMEFDKLFSNFASGAPLSKEEALEYANPLEQFRQAPSAVNKQPWRAAMDGKDVHFYLNSVAKINDIDLGIALAHFHLCAIEQGIDGEFVVKEEMVAKEKNPSNYQISFLKDERN